jgi:hypothetical protein
MLQQLLLLLSPYVFLSCVFFFSFLYAFDKKNKLKPGLVFICGIVFFSVLLPFYFVWGIFLAGFIMAFVMGAAYIVFLLLKNMFTAIIGVGIMIIVGIFMIASVSIMVLDWHKEYKVAHQEEEAKSLAMSFLNDINPDLGKKVTKINKEIALIDNNIQKLQKLQKDVQERHFVIDEKIAQWKVLREKLKEVSQNILHQAEAAYVIYKIDEIEGRKKLSLLSKELLKEADLALENAKSTKSVIEEQLQE